MEKYEIIALVVIAILAVPAVYLDRLWRRRLGFSLVELLVVMTLMILIPHMPFGGWAIVIGLVSYGVYRYVGFCQKNPSIWQMRRQARRMQVKEDRQMDRSSPNIPRVLETVRQRFLDTQADLIRRHAHEQTICHRLSVLIESELPGWQVNCEYNRQGEGIHPKVDAAGARRRPDIIVHERGNDENNLLVIEVKPLWADQQAIEEDRDKLRRMLPPPRSYQYAYLILYTDAPEPHLIVERVTTDAE